MSRSLLWLTVALATVAIVGSGASSASAQPVPSSTASSTTPNPNQNYPEVQEAIKALNSKDLPGAMKILKDLARAHAELPSEYVMLFGIFARNNQPNLARTMIERAVIESGSDPEPWVILGQIALQEGRLAEGELDYRKAGQLLEKYPNPQRKAVIEQQQMLGLASVAERRERWDDAEQKLESYLKNNPEDIVALQRLARALFTQGKAGKSGKDDPVGAYDILKRAKEIDLANAKKNKTREQMLPAEAYMAQYYDQFQHAHEKGKWAKCDRAETWFKYALKQAPDDLNLRTVVLVWALDNGEAELAKKQADEALRIEEQDKKLPTGQQKYPGSLTARMLAGYVALWDKRYADAEEFFKQVNYEAPNDFAAKNNLALTLVEQKDDTKQRRAAEYAMASYNANKENADALSTLSWVAFRTGDFHQAELAISQVLKATNGNLNPDTTTYLAYILDHGGQKFQAKQALEALINSGRSFSMKPEALALYEKVKDAKAPETSSTPTPTSTSKAP